MAQLDKLIESNKLEKLNRRNRLEDEIRNQEHYGDIEDLFDTLTKILNTHIEQNLALGEQTLRAIDWQNQQLDKQTKNIDEAASQISEWGSALGSQNAYTINETLNGTIKETQDTAPVFVDTETANILLEMGAQTNPQLKLNLVDLPTRNIK